MQLKRQITYTVFRSSGSFRSHRSSHKDAVLPISRFYHKRYPGRSSPSKQDGGNRYSFRAFPVLVNNWALFRWRAESRTSLNVKKIPLFS